MVLLKFRVVLFMVLAVVPTDSSFLEYFCNAITCAHIFYFFLQASTNLAMTMDTPLIESGTIFRSPRHAVCRFNILTFIINPMHQLV